MKELLERLVFLGYIVEDVLILLRMVAKGTIFREGAYACSIICDIRESWTFACFGSEIEELYE